MGEAETKQPTAFGRLVKQMREARNLGLVFGGACDFGKQKSAPVVSAAEVVASLKAKGMPVAEVKTYKAADDQNALLGRPHQYVSKTSWHDGRLAVSPSFDVDGGGSVETFASNADATARLKYVDAITSSVGALSEYHWTSGSTLLRVSHLLTPDQAAAYHRALG